MKKLAIISVLILSSFLVLFESTAQKKIPATLRVTVLDELGNILPGATVTIYNTQDDYTQSKNPIGTAESNKKGFVNFKKLKAQSYFIDVRKEDLSNDGEGAATDIMQEGRINKVNIVVR